MIVRSLLILSVYIFPTFFLSACSSFVSHKKILPTSLEELQGDWKIKVTSWSSEIASPKITHGLSVQSLLPGSLLLIEKNSAPSISHSSHNTALFGFDSERKTFIAFWKDPFTSRIGLGEGMFFRYADILYLSGVTLDPISKLETPSIIKAELLGEDSRVLTVFEKGTSGAVFKCLEILYYR